MKILMINKFLHPNGGSETYIFKLGQQLEAMGHQVQYFGMEHEGRCVGNRVESYTSNMDFHGGSKLSKLTYPIKTIYSTEARRKLRPVLEDFQPDVCHLNNFNYQLTPSIIPEIRSWSKKTGRRCRIIYTAHDYQLVCPNHMCRDPETDHNCEQCLGGHFINCAENRCIHGSFAKSVVGTMEATFWKWKRVYRHLDAVICCSRFLKSKLDTYPVLQGKTLTLHNFVDPVPAEEVQKEDYVLYFGRFSREKGVEILVEAAKKLPHIRFVCAGTGPLENLLAEAPNIENVGFQTGKALEMLIRKARLTVYPSTWYENCPFSVMESQIYGTPVAGARIGGIPELIRDNQTGVLFESGYADALVDAILYAWDAPSLLRGQQLTDSLQFDSLAQYCQKLLAVYKGV